MNEQKYYCTHCKFMTCTFEEAQQNKWCKSCNEEEDKKLFGEDFKLNKEDKNGNRL